MALFYKDLVFMSTLVIFSKIQYTFFVKFLYPTLFCLFSLFLCSCKIDKNLYQYEDEVLSLKNEFNQKTRDIPWIEEIEADILYTTEADKKSSAKKTDTSDTLLTSDMLFLHDSNTSRAIYPYIEGFGSLDSRSLDPKTRYFLDAFLKELASARYAKEAFLPDARYLSIILTDFIENYPLPVSWIFGEAFPLSSPTANYLEVPVKIYSDKTQDNKKAHYKLVFFLVESEEKKRIQQIQIGNIIYE